MGMADSDYSRHCTDYRNIPNDRTKKIRNAMGRTAVMSSALIFMTGGIMKSYITRVFLGVVIFNTIYVNVVFWEGVHERQRKKQSLVVSRL